MASGGELERNLRPKENLSSARQALGLTGTST
jgi:hypothetical protein